MEESNTVQPKERSLNLDRTEGIKGIELELADAMNEERLRDVKVAPAKQGGEVNENSIITERSRLFPNSSQD